MTDYATLEKIDDVSIISLDDGKVNVFSVEMLEAINIKNEGNSLVPLLKDVNTEWDIPSLTTMGFNRHTVRNKKWRYISYGGNQEELYNHDVDTMEFTNLANNPKYQNVKDEMAKYIPEVNAAPLEKVYNTKRYH